MATKPKKKEPKIVVTTEAKYEFSEKEIREMSHQLSGLLNKINTLEEQYKSSATEWKTKIKTERTTLNTLNGKLTSKYEMRDTECEVKFDWQKGTKKFIRLSDKKEVREATITESDRQMHLIPPESPKKKDKAKKEPASGEPLNPVNDAYEKAQKEVSEKFED